MVARRLPTGAEAGWAKAQLIPWLPFSYGRAYGLAEVKAQIDAAGLMGARGYLLWNPLGIYTPGALAPAS